MAKREPNRRGLFWLTMGALLFVVLAMTFMGLLAHFGFGTPIMGEAAIVGLATVIVLVLLGLTAFLQR